MSVKIPEIKNNKNQTRQEHKILLADFYVKISQNLLKSQHFYDTKIRLLLIIFLMKKRGYF